jgi:hypothetical protein
MIAAEITVPGLTEVEAARRLEETGWRPRRLEYVLSCQPMIGNEDYPQDLSVERPLGAGESYAAGAGVVAGGLLAQPGGASGL